MTYAGLEGKVAIVTGGVGGIGSAVVERLSAAGAKLVIVDLDGDRAKAAADALDGDAIGVGADVSTEAGVDAYLEAAVQTFGSADLHHLNAGIAGRPGVQLTDAAVDEWDAVMAVNLRGPFLGTRGALRHFAETGGTGSIVVTASIASLRGAADLLAYTTSKHGVVGLVHGAAVYAGPIGVRVNGVAPGIVPTPIFGEAGIQDMKKRASTSPLRRAGEPDEVAAAVAFLLSDDSSYITGAVLSVDGGASVQNTNRYGGGAGLWDTASVDAGLFEAFAASR
ncbi:SDR family oxidoreductase [Herbiconiux moechotypicola]|uniref:SDR family oxidoreductase n=1 Tax=Herbiconiux moechotypicola TaxID=637393 RepID=A0ABN3DY66_9MICO|nr:SDR family oxidoreductase [Herbiconiux moechotypicola]MCS5730812.1 SDR family oxidoreductase [Herbiconiux moechotypicola]